MATPPFPAASEYNNHCNTVRTCNNCCMDAARGAAAQKTRLEESLARLKGSRRRLAGAILSESPETYHLSSHDLARRYGVDAATVIRTVQALGYGRFADFAADLRRHFVHSVTPTTLLRQVSRDRGTAADLV